MKSPCIKICEMDAASGLCRGCGRTLQEIGRWASMGEEERDRIMQRLPERRRAAGLPEMKSDA
jgi:predicted Fe-S protein YdhL (DUF1289 family)